jgi:post-segregation antitoxin (ccd killing protein)
MWINKGIYKMSKKNKNLTVTVDTETQEYIKDLQENHDINISALVRSCIKTKYIDLNKKYR